MTINYKISPLAQSDLDGIIEYIARDNPYAAKRVDADFADAFEKLAEHPYMGHVRDNITEKALRFWPVYSYQIVYNPESSPLAIVRILSGYRDIADMLGD